jgi:hypothetical protein
MDLLGFYDDREFASESGGDDDEGDDSEGEDESMGGEGGQASASSSASEDDGEDEGSESDPEPGMRAARVAAGMRKADQVGDFLPWRC